MSSQNKLTPEEIEEIYKKAYDLEAMDEVEEIRAISCHFYRSGEHPKVFSSECKGCLDPDAVFRCRDQYLSKIYDRPSKCWTPEFDKPIDRPKEKLDTVGIGMYCNTCYMAETCPKFQKNALCSIDWDDNIRDGSGAVDSVKALDKLIEMQSTRVSRLQQFENVDGGMVDQNLSSEMDRLEKLIHSKKDYKSFKVKIGIESSAESPDGSNSDQAGGVLAKMFGMGEKSLPEKQNKKSADAYTEDAEYVEVKETKNKDK